MDPTVEQEPPVLSLPYGTHCQNNMVDKPSRRYGTMSQATLTATTTALSKQGKDAKDQDGVQHKQQSIGHVPTDWQSKALYYRVLLNEKMEAHKGDQYRNHSLAQFCVDLLDEFGSVFTGYSEVFSGLSNVISKCIFSDRITTLANEIVDSNRDHHHHPAMNIMKDMADDKEDSSVRLVKMPFFQAYIDDEKDKSISEHMAQSVRRINELNDNAKAVRMLQYV